MVSEPGMPRPEKYPLIAYYRGYCREMLHQDPRADFLAASQMPTNICISEPLRIFGCTQTAISLNPSDANAHALLGSLYMSSGMQDAAMTEWNAARELNPAIPALLRNMGSTVLHSKQSPERAIQLFTEGTRFDPQNAEIYLGLGTGTQGSGPHRRRTCRRSPEIPRLESTGGSHFSTRARSGGCWTLRGSSKGAGDALPITRRGWCQPVGRVSGDQAESRRAHWRRRQQCEEVRTLTPAPEQRSGAPALTNQGRPCARAAIPTHSKKHRRGASHMFEIIECPADLCCTRGPALGFLKGNGAV